MKFCGKCGAQLEDNQMFCGKCGAAQNGAPAGNQFQQTAQEFGNDIKDAGVKATNYVKGTIDDVKNKNADPKKFVVMGVCAAVVIFAIVFFFRCIAGPGYLSQKSAVKHYVKAMAKQNPSKLVKSTLSTKVRKTIYDDSKSDVKDYYEKYYGLDKDDKYKVKSIKISDKDKWSKSEVKAVNKYIKKTYDKNPHIKKISTVTVKYKYKLKGKSWKDSQQTLVVYKQGGNWFVADASVKSVLNTGKASSTSNKKDSVSFDYDMDDFNVEDFDFSF